jgi:hypothetical protein
MAPSKDRGKQIGGFLSRVSRFRFPTEFVQYDAADKRGKRLLLGLVLVRISVSASGVTW